MYQRLLKQLSSLESKFNAVQQKYGKRDEKLTKLLIQRNKIANSRKPEQIKNLYLEKKDQQIKKQRELIYVNTAKERNQILAKYDETKQRFDEVEREEIAEVERRKKKRQTKKNQLRNLLEESKETDISKVKAPRNDKEEKELLRPYRREILKDLGISQKIPFNPKDVDESIEAQERLENNPYINPLMRQMEKMAKLAQKGVKPYFKMECAYWLENTKTGERVQSYTYLNYELKLAKKMTPQRLFAIADKQIRSEKSGLILVAVVMIGYDIIFDDPEKGTPESIIKSLLAFFPCENQSFHKETMISTTTSKLCIWETFYYLYVNSEMTKKNKEECKSAFLAQSEEVQKIVKEGRLYDFMECKAKEMNQNMTCQFFKPESLLAFTVCPNGEIIKEDDIMALQSMKIFLYDKGHVAPRHRVLSPTEVALYTGMKKGKDEQKMPNVERVKNQLEQIEESKSRQFILKAPKQPKPLTKEKIERHKKKEEKNSKKQNEEKVENEAKPRKTRIMAFDGETRNDENYKAHAFTFCLNGEGKNKGQMEKKQFYGPKAAIDLVDYFDKIKTNVDISKTKQTGKLQQILIYGFNNSRFDNFFIYKEMAKRNRSCKIIIDQNNCIKYIKYHNIKILDLNLYYSGSLEAVSKQMFPNRSQGKGVYPYTFPNENNLSYVGEIPEAKYWKNGQDDIDEYKLREKTDKFNLKQYTLKYCMLDAELTYDIAKAHAKVCKGSFTYENSNKKMVTRKFNVTSKPTGASIALALFKQAFLEFDIHESPKHIQEIERVSYRGGRVEVFKKMYKEDSSKTKTLRYFDINSSFPSSMREIMPYKFKTKKIVDENTIRGLNDICNFYLYTAKVEYKGKCEQFIPNIVQKINGRIIGVEKTDWIPLWGVELKEAILNNCEVKIKEEYIYEGKKIFLTYSSLLYQYRQAVKNSNPALAAFYKLLLNSLYGKFGSRPHGKGKICFDKSEVYNISTNNKNKITGYTVIDEDCVYVEYSTVNDEVQIGNLVRLAAYITASARSHLSKFMRLVDHENVYYCDTDSVIAVVDLSRKDIQNEISKTELGMWKMEELEFNGKKTTEIEAAIFLAPKTYMLIPKIEGAMGFFKAKGQKQGSLTREMFELLNSTEGASVSVENPMFYRKLGGIEIKPVDRSLQPVFNKRIWNGNISMPYETIEEWKICEEINKNKKENSEIKIKSKIVEVYDRSSYNDEKLLAFERDVEKKTKSRKGYCAEYEFIYGDVEKGLDIIEHKKERKQKVDLDDLLKRALNEKDRTKQKNLWNQYLDLKKKKTKEDDEYDYTHDRRNDEDRKYDMMHDYLFAY